MRRDKATKTLESNHHWDAFFSLLQTGSGDLSVAERKSYNISFLLSWKSWWPNGRPGRPFGAGNWLFLCIILCWAFHFPLPLDPVRPHTTRPWTLCHYMVKHLFDSPFTIRLCVGGGVSSIDFGYVTFGSDWAWMYSCRDGSFRVG